MALAWIILLLALSAWLVFRAASAPLLDANLMSLLPSVDRDPVLEAASDRFLQQVERRVAILITADDAVDAKSTARTLLAELTATHLFEPLVEGKSEDLSVEVTAFYLPFRFWLLGDVARSQLLAGDIASFERGVLSRYFGPVRGLSSALVEQDPLLLLPGFLAERTGGATSGFEYEDGLLLKLFDDRTYVLLSGSLTESPFSFALQDRLLPILERADAIEHVTLSKAGVLFHAAAGRASAESEISRVGLGALLGIVVLFIVVFRSLRPLLLTLVSIAIGCFGGFVACLAAFGEVHQLTLVFGASLVGISVDYSLHYFCARFGPVGGSAPAAVLRHVGPGIRLGLVTSVIGFAGLLVAPFPGMRQVAVFSSVGLVFACISVFALNPLFDRSAGGGLLQWPLAWASAYMSVWRRLGRRTWSILALLLLPAAVGILQLQPQDNIRLLQSPSAAVLEEEARIRELLGQTLASQFFLIEGQSEAELLARDERLVSDLEAARGRGQLTGSLSLSRFMPSPDRQAENRELLKSLVDGDDSLLSRIALQVGLPDGVVERYGDAVAEAPSSGPGSLSDWLSTQLAAPYRHLWLGGSDGRLVAAVGLMGVRDPAALERLADPEHGITFVDRVGDLSTRFAEVRHWAILLTMASYAIVAVVLVARYGLRGGLLVMVAPFAAAIASVGIQGLLGEALSLFTVLALLLVLGIGVDYGIFARETGAESAATMLAIGLSAVTTILAFGLLSFSATAAVHTFGLTIFLGIFVAFLLSPVAAQGRQGGGKST